MPTGKRISLKILYLELLVGNRRSNVAGTWQQEEKGGETQFPDSIGPRLGHTSGRKDFQEDPLLASAEIRKPFPKLAQPKKKLSAPQHFS
jgi:hypothetical protein